MVLASVNGGKERGKYGRILNTPLAFFSFGVRSFVTNGFETTCAKYGTLDTHTIGGIISSSISKCP